MRRNVLVVVLLALGAAACRQDMHDAPRYKPLAASDFFADGRASRNLPAGTVARGWLRADEALYTGARQRRAARGVPVPDHQPGHAARA